jgi:hypothetical protein
MLALKKEFKTAPSIGSIAPGNPLPGVLSVSNIIMSEIFSTMQRDKIPGYTDRSGVLFKIKLTSGFFWHNFVHEFG